MISGLDRVKTVPILCSLHGDRARMRTCFFSRHLIGTAVELLQSLALHLQFHLYVDLQFDSLLMPDGSSVPIEAAATGLDLRPLKGRVEGKNTGKNVLVKSLSGIGQAGSLFLGQGSLNQPLSDSDLMRERAASNIGEAGDEEVSRLAVSQQIVVTVSAGAPIYVVLQQTPKSNQPQTGPRNPSTSSSSNVDQLRQLLQLQQELNQSSTTSNPSAQ